MKMTEWTADMRRFMEDASIYSDYNKILANEIKPYLNSNSVVCDAGCGLGFLSLELAPFAKQVLSIDVNQDVLDVARQNCEEHSISNVKQIKSSMYDLPEDMQFTDLVCCFFTSLEESMEIAKKHCSGRVFYITRNYSQHRFSSGHKKLEFDLLEDDLKFLESTGIKYDKKVMDIEFGQPFRSPEDAEIFFNTYTQPGDPSPDRDTILSMLTKTGREDFPYYYPHLKPVCIIRYDVSELK